MLKDRSDMSVIHWARGVMAQHALFRTYSSGKTVYVSEVSKHFYNKCAKGLTDIKKCTIRKDPTSRGQLSVREITSKEVLQYKS